jgi:hypothetical protein
MTTREHLDALKKLSALFVTYCKGIGVTPHQAVITGHASHASFHDKSHAETLAAQLVAAGEKPEIHHWNPIEDPDFERDEWQVSWTMAEKATP